MRGESEFHPFWPRREPPRINPGEKIVFVSQKNGPITENVWKQVHEEARRKVSPPKPIH